MCVCVWGGGTAVFQMGAKSSVSLGSENTSGCMSHLILQGFNQFSVETWARCSYFDKTGGMCFFFSYHSSEEENKKKGDVLPIRMSFFSSLSSQLWWEQQDLHRGPSPFGSKPKLCLLEKFTFNSWTKMENFLLCWASCQSCCCMNQFCHESVVLVRKNVFHLLNRPAYASLCTATPHWPPALCLLLCKLLQQHGCTLSTSCERAIGSARTDKWMKQR